MVRGRFATLVVALAACALGLILPGQSVSDLPPRAVHLERPDDAYAPPPARPKSQLPSVSGPHVVQFGRFRSVQVNVDGAGQNIPGDAANEPSLAIDPTNPNRIAVGWRQFNSVGSNFRQAGRAYSKDGGNTWINIGVFTPGVFRSDPVLEANAAGTIFYNSLQSSFFTDIFRSTDGGVSYFGPIPALGGDKLWMSIDRSSSVGRGHIYMSWNTAAGCCGPRIFTRSIDNGDNYENPIALPNSPIFGTVTVGPDGEVYVVGLNQGTPDNTKFAVAVSSTLKFPTTPMSDDPLHPATLTFTGRLAEINGLAAIGGEPNPGGLLGQIWIDVDRSNGPRRGWVYILASIVPVTPGTVDPMDVHFISSANGGQTWSEPRRINDDEPTTNAWQWFGTMSVAPNGRIDAIYNDTRNDPGGVLTELRYTSSADGGSSWLPSVVLTPPFDPLQGHPNQNKLGDYYDMESDDNGASLIFAATFNDNPNPSNAAHAKEQDVYYLRIPNLDCNSNSILDTVEIDAGLLIDCNTNDLPDACESGAAAATDCQTNGIPDECESIGDCNTNSLPDVCDLRMPAPESVVPADECEDARDICPGVDYVGSTESFGVDARSGCDSDNVGPDVWYSYSPTQGGLARFSLCGSSFDTVMSIHPDCQTAPPQELACDDNGCGIASTLTFDVVAGARYLIRVSTTGGTNDGFIMVIQGPPCNENDPTIAGLLPGESSLAQDRCSDAQLACPPFIYAGSTETATSDGAASCEPNSGAPDVWYVYEPETDGSATVSLCNTTIDTVLSIHTSCARSATSDLGCNDDFCGVQSESTLTVTAGARYLIRVAGKNGASGDYKLRVTGPPCQLGPVIDCNTNGTLDACDPDCNTNRRPDSCELTLADCDTNGVLDVCSLADGAVPDCNTNARPDRCDVAGTTPDCDSDGVPDACEPNSDLDSRINDCDGCPNDPVKVTPGACGCGVADTDSDRDGTANCADACPNDPAKTAPGLCGCGVSDADSDADGTPNCRDGCPTDPARTEPGICGCEATVDSCNARVGCPQNITLSATSLGGAVLIFALPSVPSRGAFTQVVSSHPSGTLFPVGSTVVTIDLRDTITGESHTCSFVVTVNPVPGGGPIDNPDDGNGGDFQPPPAAQPQLLCGIFNIGGLVAESLLIAGLTGMIGRRFRRPRGCPGRVAGWKRPFRDRS